MIQEGMDAPDFVAVDQGNKEVALSGFAGKWVVLYFYPKDNTPGCTIEAVNFSAKKAEFEALGAVILGVSPDSVESHCKFIDKKKLTITLLSDESKELCEKYGVWQLKKFMGREYMGVVRSTFLISPDGKIAAVWSPVKVKGHVDDVLEKVKGLQ